MYSTQKQDIFNDFPNRSDFIQSFDISLCSGNTTIVLLLRMNIFDLSKYSLNCSYHNQVLYELASRLRLYNPQSTLMCKCSGNEFLIILTHLNSYTEVSPYLDYLIKECTTPISINNQLFDISVNIGVSLFLDHSSTLVDLIYKADIALSHSLLNGPNQYYLFDTYEKVTPTRAHQIHTTLQTALVNNEIYPVFQPKISAKDNSIVGFEALARWDHPVLGSISPCEFIPIAEKTHMIFSIGLFMFEQSCRRCRELVDMGYSDLNFSINVSKIQVQDASIIKDFMDILYKYDLNSRYIELEITENFFENNLNQHIPIFQQFKNLGLSLALDDFGTGTSCFEYLRHLPVDTLKIDKCFIDDIGINPTVHFIIQCIITMSHQLNMKVVAEGVETFAQANFLKNLNCDILQGYFYSKPVHFNELLAIL